MLADPNIDAVIISTPDHHHARITIDAIQSGKHVYCEKSLIHREEEIYATYEAVKNSNLVFQQGHQYPQTAAFQVAKGDPQSQMAG
jgi:predicted dehydrogenase